MLGTPEYMAPERARGQDVGPAADVWAMGVVSFECLCGKLPFTATNLNGIAAQIISGEVLRARVANPNLPTAIAAVIDRALMNAPEQRHANMAQFAHALGAAALSAGLNVPADPDPIGLPNFATLHLEGDPWASGPLAKVFSAAAEKLKTPASARELVPSLPNRARSWKLPFVLVALSLLGLIVSLTFKSAAPAPPALVPAELVRRPEPVQPIALPVPSAPAELASEPAPPPATGSALAPSELPSASEAGRMNVRERARARAASPRAATRKTDQTRPLGPSEFEKEWN
jgi:serine/threonine-protein kinase